MPRRRRLERRPDPDRYRRSIVGAAVLASFLSVALAIAAGAGASPPLEQKRAQASAILAQIQQLDGEVGAAAERWNGANYELARISAELRQARSDLMRAKVGVRVSQERISSRLRELYIEGAPSSAAEVILGARSLTEILDLLDTAGRIAEQDGRIARDLAGFRHRVAQRERELVAARGRQAVLVQRRAAERVGIERRLAERKRLLASVRSEVARLQAREAARQEALRRRAAQELARQIAAVAAARARAEQAAALQRLAAAAAARDAQVPQPSSGQSSPPRSVPPVASAGTGAPPVGGPAAVPPPAAGGPVAAPSPGDVGVAVPPPGTTPALPAGTASPSAPSPPDAARSAQVVSIAMRYLGVPYKWGAASPSVGFDCSGLTMYVFAQVGVSLPHYAAAQYTMGAAVSRDQLQPGDLVFFSGLGHMGMYIGGGSFIHAPQTGDVVKISSLSERYYASNWVGARRVL